MTNSNIAGIICIVIGGIGSLLVAFPWLPKYLREQAKSLLSRVNWNFLPFALLLIGGIWVTSGGSHGTSCSVPVIPVVSKTYPDAWVVIVEESSERSKETALLLQDWDWRQSLQERDINLRVYDVDQPDASSYAALNLQLPAIVFVTPEGKVVSTAKLPQDKKGVESLIQKVTGK